MARKAKCPDTPKGIKRHDDRGGSTHRDQRIGLFKAEVMQVCIDEINHVEGAARLNNEKPKKSRNQIAKEFGLSLSSVSSDTVPFVSWVGTPALPSSLVVNVHLVSSLGASPPQKLSILHKILSHCGFWGSSRPPGQLMLVPFSSA